MDEWLLRFKRILLTFPSNIRNHMLSDTVLHHIRLEFALN